MPPKTATKRKFILTPTIEEGPYYSTGSPERNSIAEKGTLGIKLILEGKVLDKNGQPIAHAWLDFWQADGKGAYDNIGYNLRGYQYTDKNGRYHLETVRPLGYQMRAAHIHAKVQASEKTPVLTYQLYFPGEKKNETDFLFNPGTLMDVKETPEGQQATFDFVVKTE